MGKDKSDDKDENVIKVSFKNTKKEQELKIDVLKQCEIYGKSTWMKLAAREKLERDKNNTNNSNNATTIRTTSVQKPVSDFPIINELSDIFSNNN